MNDQEEHGKRSGWMTGRELVLGAQEERRRKKADIARPGLARYDMMSQTIVLDVGCPYEVDLDPITDASGGDVGLVRRQPSPFRKKGTGFLAARWSIDRARRRGRQTGGIRRRGTVRRGVCAGVAPRGRCPTRPKAESRW
jgi:hypothetical protein